MKINRNKDEGYLEFQELKVGDCFIKRDDPDSVYMKAVVFNCDNGVEYNTVCLNDGRILLFLRDWEVILVKAELTIE